MKINFTKKLFVALFAVACFSFNATAQTVIFSETFNGGIPATWSNNAISSANPDSTANAVWVWSADGSSQGAYGSSAIASPSIADGAVVFDSDFLDNAGTQGNFGGGSAPSPQVSELVSPSIDCSAYGSVAVQFNQHFRNFQAQTFVGVSVDGGMTWTSFEVNAGTATNAAIDPATQSIVDITSVAANQSDVRIKFEFNGDYYYWAIDDVQIITLPNNNLSVGDFLFPVRSQFTPASQIDSDTMFFSVDLSNEGGADQTNVVVKAEVTNDAGLVVFADSTNIGTLAVGVADSTFDLPNFFLPTTTNMPEAIYTVAYSVSSDSMDFDMGNNVASEDFAVTDTLFSKETGATGGLRPGGGGDYKIATYYKISSNVMDGDFKATSVSFACAKNSADGPLQGDAVTIFLYEVNDYVDAGFNNFDETGDNDLTIVGTADYTFGAEGNYDLVTLTLKDFITNSPGVELKAGGRYFLAVNYIGTSNVIFQGFNNTINYFQISTLAFTSQWFFGGFGPEDAAIIRMGIEAVNSTEMPELEEGVLSVFPNPATDYINVDLDFAEATDANISIIDITGKVLYSEDQSNVTAQQFRYNTSDYAAGTYIVRVSTNEGAKSTRFVVTK